jgi:hypothetical protein
MRASTGSLRVGAVAVQRLALDVLHHEVGVAVRRHAAIQQARDIGMGEGGQQLPLVTKAAHEFLAGQVRGHHFQCDGLIELSVVPPCQIDRAHAAAAQQPLRPIGTEAAPGLLRRKLAGFSSGLRLGGAAPLVELPILAVRHEQGPNLRPQRRIESGLRGEPPFAFGCRLFERGVK